MGGGQDLAVAGNTQGGPGVSAQRRALDVFQEALELEAAQRADYLDQVYAREPELRVEIESLFGVHGAAASFLEAPLLAPDGDAATTVEQVLPERIGQYAIEGMLGQGGMGVVYRAVQEGTDRIVALKVIQQRVFSLQTLRRFEYETRVLGRLHHPGIAAIFEAGTVETDHGRRPFFAMELVRGQELTQYARQQRLPARARLELLARVSDAVHHAHQMGVIHRDLKPGNILVDETGCPKVLDFGVAKATDGDLHTTTLQTYAGQLVGTIPYMSPEQIAGSADELDIRCDVYALGVIGYELLAGRTPHDIREKSVLEAVRIVVEEEPPSIRALHASPGRDAEIIIAKAMAKDRSMRYASASDLSADIRRLLANEPIAARSPTAAYRFRKFARRNPTLTGLILLLAVALVAGTSVSTWQAIRAARAEGSANQQRDIAMNKEALALGVVEFLNIDLLGAAIPDRLGQNATVREVLDAAAAGVDEKFVDEPLLAAAIHQTIGAVYAQLDEYELAARHLQAAVERRARHAGNDATETFESRLDLAQVYAVLGRLDEAESLLAQSIERARRVDGPDHARTLVAMEARARLHQQVGRYAEAEEAYQALLEIRQRVLGRDAPATLHTMNNLGSLYVERERYADAEPLLAGVVEARRAAGDRSLGDTNALNNLALLYVRQQRYVEAESLYQELLAIRREMVGESHSETLTAMSNLAGLYFRTGRYDQAEQLYASLLPLRRARSGDAHIDTLLTMSNLGVVYLELDRVQEAEALLAEAARIGRSSLPPNHVHLGMILGNHGKSLIARDRLTEAEGALLQAHEILIASFGPEHSIVRRNAQSLVTLYEALDRPAEAAKWSDGRGERDSTLE